ncbi:MAG TPA: rod shape-determining protein MreC [Blastocatellia bacterium]|nr:rod shape-determining protein MreC [Blastocatellia bacterium]
MSRASERQTKQKYAPYLLVALLASQLLTMALTARSAAGADGNEQSILKSWMLTIVTPIQSALGSGFSGIGSFWSGYVDLRGVRDRNTALEAENAQLRAEIESARALSAENDRLRRELDLKPLLRYDSVTAEVVARDANVWFKRLVVNKGSLDGIKPNQPVVTPDGLVGRVTSVGAHAAQIQLISDEHAGVGGRLTTSRAAGELKGRGDGTCRMKSISSLEVVDTGEPVLTSGLDRIYPAGILIGYVTDVAPGAGASPHDITIRTAADLDRVEVVMILLVDPVDLSTPDTVK